MYTYAATVTRVIDADSICVNVDLGFSTFVVQKLRLYGIDAPELKTDEGKAARAVMRQMLEGKGVVIKTQRDKQEKYGRYLATVLLGPLNVNEELCRLGHAKVWNGLGPHPWG